MSTCIRAITDAVLVSREDQKVDAASKVKRLRKQQKKKGNIEKTQ